MPQMLSPSEQLTYSTARIECETPDGPSSGTGFFYRFLDDGERHLPAVVTNRHVVRGAKRGRFHLTLRGADGGPTPGRHLGIVLEDFANRWIGHPDASVDLSVMPIAPLLTQAQQAGHQFFFIALDNSLAPTPDDLRELTALEEIIMIGYPNGIWDSVNNMPIIRRGVTATHPNFDYEGRREFMIDAACFPGSSGSPVFLFNLGGWASRDGTFNVGGARIKLLGILYAGPQHTATGEIRIVDVPTTQQPLAISRIPNNLGLVIKSGRLTEFDDLLRPTIGGAA
jgi:hypothetical protein